MSKALYRVYRPKSFDEVYGQDPIVKILKNSVKAGTFSHAYLFCGPRGTGKTSIARIMAKSINCLNSTDGNPDEKCANCQLINDSRTMDIIEIDAASHTQVDNIRDVIIDRANFIPTNLKYKVYIIDEAHMLSKSSFNALLKTLEEPPEHTVLILATTEVNKIPSTIVSRCQRFDFKRIRRTELVERLGFIAQKENIKIENSALEMIARASEGGFRDAISLLDQLSQIKKDIKVSDIENLGGFSNQATVEDIVQNLIKKETRSALEIINKYQDDGFDLFVLQKNLVEYLRRLLVISVAGEQEIFISKETTDKLNELAKQISTEELIRFIGIILETDRLYRYSYLPQLSFEVSVIKICSDSKPSVNETVPLTKDKTTTNEQKEIKQTPAKANGNGQWQQVLLEIKARNNSIHACLKVSEPFFEDNNVVLSFPYAFHKEMIEETKNRQVVEDIMKRVYKKDYRVKCLFKPSYKNEEKSTVKDDLLNEALEIFGGEVIE